MGNFKLQSIILDEENGFYRVAIVVSIEDPEIEHHKSFVNCDFTLRMDTKDLSEIENKAIAKAESLLRKVLQLISRELTRIGISTKYQAPNNKQYLNPKS